MNAEMTAPRDLLPGGPVGFLGRRWLIILVPLVVLTVASYLNSVRKPPVYRSSVRLLVQESNLRSPLLDSYALDLDLEAQLAALEKTATRPIVLDRVRRRLEEATGKTPGAGLPELADNLEIEVAADGGVYLVAHGRSPEEAQLMVDIYQDVCVAELNRPRVEAAEKIVAFLEAEFQQARSNLDHSQGQLTQYRAAHGKVLPELEAITYNLLLGLEAEQVQLDSQRHAMAEKRKQLEADPGVRGQTVAGLVEQIERLRNDLQAQAGKMTEDHPDLQIMRARLNRLELDLSLRRQGLTPPDSRREATRVEEDYRLLLIEQEALEERIRRVNARVEELQTKIASASNHDSEYVRRLRDVESHTEIYLDLVRRRARAATSRHLVETNHGDLVRVLQAASLPDEPDSPRPVQELILGLVAGLVAGLGLAVGAELTDGRLYGPRNLEAVLGAPALLVLDQPK
jgi:succinoglycan biosynthesis transport protein ExoP